MNGSEATFTVRRDAALSNKHFRETIVEVDSTPAPYIYSVRPSGAAVGDDVLVQGSYFGVDGADIAAFTIDGQAVVTYTRIDANHIVATIPALVTGAANVVITTTSGGASNTYAYAAAVA